MFRTKAPCILVLGSFTAAIFAANKPLDRMTPVPANEPIPIIDFFRPRIFSDPKLNPAGTHFAAIISTKEDNHDLMCFDLVTKKAERLSGGKDFDVNRFDWLNDKRLFFSVVRDKMYAAGLFAAEVGRFNDCYVLQRYNVILPIGFPKKTPLEAIVWNHNSVDRGGGDGGVLRISTRKLMSSKDGSLILNDDGMRADIVRSYPEPKGGEVVSYLCDREGELAFAITSKDGVTTLLRFVNEHWERSPTNLGDFDIEGVGDKPDELLILGPREATKPRALFRLDAATGKLGALLFQDETYSLDSARIYRHPVDQHVLGLQYSQAGPTNAWFDPAYERIQAQMEKALPNLAIRIIGSDLTEKHFFVSAYSDLQPPTYYHVKMDSNSFSLISNVAPWIDPTRMSPMRPMSYKNRDGVMIDGYLTLPLGSSKENPPPVVVLAHGGPWVRDVWGWNAEVQFLASRGYAVFQPNYRGSSGTAWKFPEEDLWEFRKMHDDVTDGVRRLIKSGLIDPKRIAIMGGSFGGYLSLCGVAYEPNLYRCAVMIAGVYDWERAIAQAKGSEYRRGAYGQLKLKLGDPAAQRDRFDDISPVKHVAGIKVPLLIAHGGSDIVADFRQAKELMAELKKNNIPFQKHIERDEGHGFQHLDNQVALYTEIEAFLAKNMAR